MSIDKSPDGVVSICNPNDIHVEWREIPGFSKYQACNLGLIRNKKSGKVSTLYEVRTSIGSYFNVSAVSDDLRYRAKQVHDLVCRAFHGPPPSEGHEVNHKDGNKHHNLPDNVEWMTRSENLTHAYENGLRKDNVPILVTDVRTGEVERFATMASLARYLRVSPGKVGSIVATHRHLPYLDLYTFEKDYSDRQVTGWSWVRDIVAYDYVERAVILASDAGQMEWLTGVKRQTITWHLRESTDRNAMVSGYVFRYRDEYESMDDLPAYSVKEAKESRKAYVNKTSPRPKRYGVRAKNYLDGTVTEYATFKEAAEDLGISKGTIRYLLGKVFKRPFKGYGFQYLDDPTEFPEFDAETIQLSLVKKKPELPSLRVTDLETNTTKLYPSVKAFASEIGVSGAGNISKHIREKSDVPYRNRYSLELVY